MKRACSSFVPDAVAINELSGVEQAQDSFTVTVSDGINPPVTSTFTVTITPEDDAPTLAVEVAAPDLLDSDDTFANLEGQLDGADVDTATLTYAIVDETPDATTGATTVAGAFGELTVQSDGSYTYVPDAVAINALPGNADEPTTDTFSVQVSDGTNPPVTSTLTVNIIPDDDAPTLEVVELALADE